MLFQLFTKFIVGIVVISLVFGLFINIVIELDDIIVIIAMKVKLLLMKWLVKMSGLYS